MFDIGYLFLFSSLPCCLHGLPENKVGVITQLLESGDTDEVWRPLHVP